MRKRLSYIRLSVQEELELIKLTEKWGCRRSEVLRFAFRSFLLNGPGRSPKLVVEPRPSGEPSRME
jgi:hypothetical protein